MQDTRGGKVTEQKVPQGMVGIKKHKSKKTGKHQKTKDPRTSQTHGLRGEHTRRKQSFYQRGEHTESEARHETPRMIKTRLQKKFKSPSSQVTLERMG